MTPCLACPRAACGNCPPVSPDDIGGDIKRTDGPLSDPACSFCRNPVVVGLQVVDRDPWSKEYRLWRYCKECAKAAGELQDQRAQQAIAEAEGAGA